MPNRVIHFEIHAQDTAKSADFYRKVFGWEIKSWDNPLVNYWSITTGPEGNSAEPGINGGIVARESSVPPKTEPSTTFVINVSSVDEYIKKIIAAGGRNVVKKMAIHGMAWLAYCTDIEGNVFGLYEADPKAQN